MEINLHAKELEMNRLRLALESQSARAEFLYYCYQDLREKLKAYEDGSLGQAAE